VSPTVTLSVAVHTIDLTVTDDDLATDTDSVQITVNAYVNQAPAADAGPDQNVTDTDQGGGEDVTLDASGSSDSDGTIVSYDWEESSVPIATGVSPTVTLTVAVHTIDLTVTDDDSATDSDSVVITVEAGGVAADIAFDAASSANDADIASLSWSHTLGSGADRLLVVGLASEDNNTGDLVVSSVTYDGVAMALIPGSSVESNTGWRIKADLYYMLDANLPAAGTYTVAVTYSGSISRIGAGAISLANVAQQAAEAVNTSANAAPVSIATNVTTLTDGAWLVDVVGSGNPDSFTATASGQVERYDEYTGGSTTAGSTKPVAAAGAATMSWDYDGGDSNRMAHSVAAFAPASAAPPANNPPTADAGTDQNVTDTDGGGDKSVTLDGSASSDSDGTIVSWAWEEDSSQIATGESPAVTMDVGVHMVDLTVTDDDSATDTDSVIVTVVSRTLTSDTSFQNTSLPSHAGVFTVEFDAVPHGNNIDACTSLSQGAATWWPDLACTVRFHTDGEIDVVYDDDLYGAANVVAYTAETNYHFRMVIDVPSSTYSVYVTPQGQSEVTLATDYSFRLPQVDVASLDNWSFVGVVGTHTISNLTISD